MPPLNDYTRYYACIYADITYVSDGEILTGRRRARRRGSRWARRTRTRWRAVHLGPAARRVQGLPGRPGGQRLGHVPGDGARRAQELQLPRPVRRQHQFHGGALQSEHWQCGYTDVVAGRSWIREFCQEQRSVRCYFPARRWLLE